MKDDREEVLGQIRTSLKTAHLPAARATIPPREVESDGEGQAMVARFRRELEPIGGLSYVVANDEEAIDLTIKLTGESGGKDVLAWGEEELPVRNLYAALRANGFAMLDARVPNEREARRAKYAELEKATVGITGALAGLADTGSVALLSGAKRPRLASLLPPTHIALLRVEQLYPTMAAFFGAYPNVVREASNLVFVTGPSRTADIELTLTRGVHGPRFVHVVLIG